MKKSTNESPIDRMTKFRQTNNNVISKFQNINNHKTANNINSCSNAFLLQTYQQIGMNREDTKKYKIKPFYLCRNKFCSNCAYLRSKKLFVETYQVIENIKIKKNIDFLPFHLTLTVKNPTVKEYRHYHNIINQAFKLLMKKTSKYKFKDYVLGYQSSRETTQSPEAKLRNELHPHIHVLLLLKPEFYNETTRTYKLTKNDILEEWNKCLKNYDKTFPECTQLDFKRIKNKTDIEALEYGNNVDLENSAIAEVSKYPVKTSDLTNMSDNHFDILNDTLFGARLITYGGLIKEVRAELKMKDDEIKDMFLNQKQYECIKVELYNLICNRFVNVTEYKLNYKNDRDGHIPSLNQVEIINNR